MNVWVLVDERVGSSKQSVALAEILKQPYEIKKVQYTWLAKIPNFLSVLARYTITAESRKELVGQKAPDIIIGAGRNLARVSKYLKSLYPKVKLIQILKPDMYVKNFDVLVLPHHDHIMLPSGYDKKRVIRVDGAVTHITKQEIESDLKEWSPKFANMPRPRITLLIGGSAKDSTFTAQHAKDLIHHTISIASRLNASVMVTNSRRTTKEINDVIFGALKASNIQHIAHDTASNAPNPYKGFLACADYIIVTGDSIAMCTESLAYKKPVIIFAPKSAISKKHWRFIEQLVSDGQVNLLRNFDPNTAMIPKDKSTDIRHNILSAIGMKLS